MNKPLLKVKEIKQYYPAKGGVVKANDGISLTIYEGETLGLVGESGCGKSTLGRTILGLDPPSSGAIYYYGVSVNELKPAYLKKLFGKLPKKKTQYQHLMEQGQEEKAEELICEIARDLGGMVCYEDWMKLSKAGAQWCRGNGESWEVLREQCRSLEQYAFYESMKEEGVNLTRLTVKEFRTLRKELQIVFQDPYSSLNPKMTVGQLIGEGVQVHGIVRGKERQEDYILQVMERCGLSPYMIHRYPHQFSGGQRQRIGIARSLALKPKFLVCDEAVSALDVSIQAQVINLLVDLKKEQNLTYLFISHDFSVIRYVSDRIGVMYLGKLVELASAGSIFDHPMHPYTKVLLSAIPSLDGQQQQELALIGEPPKPQNPPSGCRFHTRCVYCSNQCVEQEPALREVEEGHVVACHYAESIGLEEKSRTDSN